MLDHEELLLFGAPAGEVVDFALSVSHHDALSRVRLTGRSVNRKEQMRLDIITDRNDSVFELVGWCTPALQRSRRMSGELYRRTLWAIHDRAGREGFDVTITGCGRRKRSDD